MATDRELPGDRTEGGGNCPAQEGATYLGFEEVLGTSDALQGHVDLRQLGQRHQPTLLLQLPGCRLVEDEQELMGKVDASQRQHRRQIYNKPLGPAPVSWPSP